MVHPVAEQESPPAAFAHVRDLWQELCNSRTGPRTKIQRILDVERDEFDLPLAFLSRIDREADREYFEVVAGEGVAIEEGDAAPLSETYCRKTLEAPEGTLAVSDARAEGWADDPAFERFDIGSYLGATVEGDGDLHGTLCFVRRDPRPDPIDEREVELLDMLADWVGYELAVRADEGATTTTDVDLPPRSLWSNEVDAVMTALARKPRRIVLASLVEGSIENEADLQADGRWGPADGTALRHNHLPRLDEAEFVEWDRERGTIEKGPQFDAVADVLRCVRDSIDEIE